MAFGEEPVWFLDIDGVINSWPTPPTDSPWQFVNKKIGGYPIWWATEVVDFINEMHAPEEPDALEVQWLTTWEDRAVDLFAPQVGIQHEFSVQPRTYYGWDRWWKAERIEMFRAEFPDRPLIWTDDEIYDYLTPAAVTALVGDNSLVISPYHYKGLTAEHLNAIAEFTDKMNCR